MDVKYLHTFVSECWRQGWKAHSDPIEVGCQGFVGHSFFAKNFQEAIEKLLTVAMDQHWGLLNAC